MPVRESHPILCVRDPYAERDFFALFGFETVYKGSEFPGFLAILCGSALFGLAGNKELPTSGADDGVKSQLLVDDVNEQASTCARERLTCEVVVEAGGITRRARIARGDPTERRGGVVRRSNEIG